MKIGLLGFGSMGKTHSWCVKNLGYFYKDLPFSVEYGGVCTTRQETADAAARMLGITNAVTDEDKLIYDESIDIIDICTPNVYHFETLKKALKAGKHVYCEKPLTVTYEQAKEIAELAERSGVINQMVFNNRFMPPVLKAKELIETGRLGRILSFRCEYLHASAADPNKNAGWKQNKDICGAGTLFDLGSHATDLIYYLCGNITSVMGKSQIGYPTRKGMDGKAWQTNADEAFYMICETEGGAVGTVEASKLTVGANDELNLSVYGEKGSVKFSLMEPNWLWFYDAERPDGSYGGERGYTKIECCGRYPLPGGIFPSFKAPIGWLRGHLHCMYSFLSCVHENRPASPSLFEGAEVQKVLENALVSDNNKGIMIK